MVTVDLLGRTREMRKRNVVLASLGGVAAGALGFALRSTGLARATEQPSGSASRPLPDKPVPVVVELFTSEGCSSCPPADEVLAGLEKTQPVPGALVVPLAYHVDYWDELGWPDPFAAPAFTSRQHTYAVRGRMYTPQAVVDGRTELVGSNARGLQHAIEQAALETHVPVQIAVRSSAETIEASVHVGQLPRGPSGGSASDAVVLVAVTQARATVAVPRGENAGRTLRHTAVVRQLESAGTVPFAGGDARVSIRIPYNAPRAELRVVAFVQRVADHVILGSATRRVTADAQPLQPP